ncbi:MAG: transglutaminase domain-containing protein [Clostridia bacterium]|nr:transglutaminase domain-containing protein [Clostridia bacterium]MBQ8971793.1 transglutaminase domain-containing protein [Clostridia bacterium]
MKSVSNHRLWRVFLLVGLMWIAAAVSAHASSDTAVWPEHPGTDMQVDGNLIIDCSHMDEGYFMACVSSASSNRMKLRVTINGGQLMYDLNNTGEYEAFPLQFGSGSYKVELFENVKSNKYSAEGGVTLSAQLSDPNAAFLVPNQYVSYSVDSQTVAKSDEITASLSSPKEIYDAVCSFMTSEFSYDFVRASTISSGALPEVDPCYDKRSGICQDLSAVMICMLRVQGIPSKLMIGYADQYYHAWTVSVVNGEEIFFDPTAAIGALNAKKYQIERFY